jgi:hypothetical protein
MGLDPPVSRAQQALMCAAARGESTSNVPRSVGEKYCKPISEDEDDDAEEEDRKLRALLSRHLDADGPGFERAFDLARRALDRYRRRRAAGGADQPPPFKGMPEPGGTMLGDRALQSFEQMYPEAAKMKPRTLTNTRVFVR